MQKELAREDARRIFKGISNLLEAKSAQMLERATRWKTVEAMKRDLETARRGGTAEEVQALEASFEKALDKHPERGRGHSRQILRLLRVHVQH